MVQAAPGIRRWHVGKAVGKALARVPVQTSIPAGESFNNSSGPDPMASGPPSCCCHSAAHLGTGSLRVMLSVSSDLTLSSRRRVRPGDSR